MVSPLKSTNSNGALSSPKFGWGINTGLLKIFRPIITEEVRPQIRPKTMKPFSS